MKLAYLILAHKNFDQLSYLVKLLKEDWNEIFIHIDGKSNFDKKKFIDKIENTKVYFVTPRVNVYWGHISQVEAIFRGLLLVVESNLDFDRVVLLSGQDLPVVSNKQIYDFFDCNRDVEFLEFAKFPVRWWPFGGYDRVLVYNFPDILGPRLNRIFRIFQMIFFIRRKDMKNFCYYGSSTWFNITGHAAKYIVSYIKDNNLIERFNYTYCVDEIIFQTILLSSEISKNCVNNSLRYIVWNRGNSHPLYLSYEDYIGLVRSNRDNLKYLFARKFSSSFQMYR